MTYQVRSTKRVNREVSLIAAWYRDKSGTDEVADRWVAGLRKTMAALAKNPEFHSLAREAEALGEDVYEVFYGSGRKKSHRILFRIIGDEGVVEVIGVRHFAQRDLTADDF